MITGATTTTVKNKNQTDICGLFQLLSQWLGRRQITRSNVAIAEVWPSIQSRSSSACLALCQM